MKKIIYCLLVIALLSSLFLGCAPKPAGPITLKFATFVPERSLSNVLPFRYVEALEERAGGELIIKFIGGPEAIPMDDQLEALASGVIDLNYSPATDIPAPGMESIRISPLTPWEEVEVGYYDWLVEKAEMANMRYLGRAGKGGDDFWYMYSNVRVEKPQDFAGIKFRAGTSEPLFQELGAILVATEMTEIYTAMDQGVIEGFAFPWRGVTRWGWPEVTKYVIDVPFNTSDGALMVNLDTWKRLPKHLRELMVDLMREMEPEFEAFTAEQRALEMERWQEAGLEFIQWSPGDAKWFVARNYEEAWEEEIELWPEYESELRKIQALLAK